MIVTIERRSSLWELGDRGAPVGSELFTDRAKGGGGGECVEF